MESLFKNLNPRQVEAVSQITGATLVLAGAGSGKTTVLTRRVAYLLSQGVVPGKILCLTFTNKAAREMYQRVQQLLQQLNFHLPVVPPWQTDYINVPLLCTFHSLGARLLREFGEYVGLTKDFTILDDDDRKKIGKQLLQEMNLDSKVYPVTLMLHFVSQCKQELLTASQSQQLPNQDYPPVFHNFYKLYERTLQASKAVDFDDLLLLPYLIISQNSEVQKILLNRWHHIMVDEFQDTNTAQFALIKLLAPAEWLDKS